MKKYVCTHLLLLVASWLPSQHVLIWCWLGFTLSRLELTWESVGLTLAWLVVAGPNLGMTWAALGWVRSALRLAWPDLESQVRQCAYRRTYARMAQIRLCNRLLRCRGVGIDKYVRTHSLQSSSIRALLMATPGRTRRSTRPAAQRAASERRVSRCLRPSQTHQEGFQLLAVCTCLHARTYVRS